MIWYPYEQLKTMKAPYEIVDANGVYLYTKDQKMIDSVSSWWSVIHGYKHPVINQAIISQVEKFSHVMLGGLTHEPARKLSEKLASWLPGDLDYCFFSDSGSVAVEVALKMALQYYMNRGDEKRTMILALEHAYHGDTFKTMEAGDDEDYHFVLKAYGASPYVVHIPTEITALEEAFEKYHDRLNCVLVEPILQGAGGMRMYDVSFLKKARELCDQYGVLLVFDEVATGFGRTGNRFVADLVLPDILVLGKALTGGYIGHAATVASIELFETQNYMEKIKRIEAVTRREMKGFTDPRIREVRIMGGCVCVEVYDPAVLKGYQEYACKRGVFSRPFLNYLYAMVPYVIQENELVQVLQCMKDWFAR